MILLAALLYWLGVQGMRTVDDRYSARELARRFAHSLVPIALAYVLAHYFSLLAYQGQAAAYLASDPLGRRLGPVRHRVRTRSTTRSSRPTASGTSRSARSSSATSPAWCWRTTARSSSSRTRNAATRSQYWMLAVMVAFTSLGLWLLSSAQPMIVPPAHAGHWLAELLYVLPVLVIVLLDRRSARSSTGGALEQTQIVRQRIRRDLAGGEADALAARPSSSTT